MDCALQIISAVIYHNCSTMICHNSVGSFCTNVVNHGCCKKKYLKMKLAIKDKMLYCQHIKHKMSHVIIHYYFFYLFSLYYFYYFVFTHAAGQLLCSWRSIHPTENNFNSPRVSDENKSQRPSALQTETSVNFPPENSLRLRECVRQLPVYW